jgi:spore photoproduct lyase
MMIPIFDKILINPDAADADLTRRILKNLPGVPIESADETAFELPAEGMTLTRGKHILYLTNGRGSLVKPCPGTSEPYLCCGYTVVNQQTHCPMDCTYCILQNYLERPAITVHVNIEQIFLQIGNLLQSQPDRFFRIGTGELTDSLALDPVTEISRDLLGFFGSKDNSLLELKTKTDNIRNLLKQPIRRAVISWSLNPPVVIDAEEHLSASLDQRLSAAKKCAEAGFLIGFHFDPIVPVDGWERGYTDLVDRMLSEVDPSRIAWISLGSLRFPPALKDVVESRFPKSRIAAGEMIRGLDGKMRYPKPVRLELYRRIAGRIREKAPGVFVYFCMEPPDVWERVLGKSPSSNEELDRQFAVSLKRRYPELG